MIPAPVIEEIDGIHVVRDDLLPGGTKRRVIPLLLGGAEEFVYASPAYGYAQVALAYSCAAAGKRATIFTAKRKALFPLTAEAARAGAKIVQVPHGYLSNVRAKARAYCEASGAMLLPFGLDCQQMLLGIADVGASLEITPAEVWTVAGSGTLTRALQLAWPQAEFFAVRIGAESDCGRATVITAPEEFAQPAKIRPPFPSCSNYDAKAWRFIRSHASPGALFWNVAA